MGKVQEGVSAAAPIVDPVLGVITDAIVGPFNVVRGVAGMCTCDPVVDDVAQSGHTDLNELTRAVKYGSILRRGIRQSLPTVGGLWFAAAGYTQQVLNVGAGFATSVSVWPVLGWAGVGFGLGLLLSKILAARGLYNVPAATPLTPNTPAVAGGGT